MKRTDIARLFGAPESFAGSPATVAGWVKTSRESKSVGFLELNDGSCFKNLQVVLAADKLADFKTLANLPVGTAIIVRGEVALTPGAKQPLELEALSVEIEGECPSDYPLQKKRHTLEYLRTMPHLRARTNTYSAAFRVRGEAAYAIHEFFHANGFVYVHTPIITGSDCEGAGTMFRVTTLDPKAPPLTDDGEVDWSQDFFGRETNLTVSGQLEGETMAQTFGKIYTFGPTFRAERSNTPRHAAEFWMIEPEMAFSDLTDYMDNAEAMVKYVVKRVLERCGDEIRFFNDFYDKGLLARLSALVDAEFARVSYTEACSILERHNDEFDYKVSWGCDLQTEHERCLTEKIYERPVFVTDYPKGIKAFYMRVNEDGRTVAAADMLVPGVGELVGGSQREERLEVLERRIAEMGLNRADYEYYLDLRRYGSTKHSGYGLGFERLIMYLTSVGNIRDVQLYPRNAGGF